MYCPRTVLDCATTTPGNCLYLLILMQTVLHAMQSKRTYKQLRPPSSQSKKLTKSRLHEWFYRDIPYKTKNVYSTPAALVFLSLLWQFCGTVTCRVVKCKIFYHDKISGSTCNIKILKL
uniref:Uncharacterized protein n=1 Tax=Rhipicephalus microplus TaxID=6941 RepID=A0A6G5AH06_RHIMP